MPKYGIHHIVLKEVEAKLAATTGTTAQATQARRVATLLAGQPFASSLGAIGPDLLFWAPDYEIVKSLELLIKVDAEINEQLAKVDELVEKLDEFVDDTVDNAVNALSTIPGIGPVVVGIHSWVVLLDAIADQYKFMAEEIKGDVKGALFAKVLGLDGSGTNNGMARNLFQTLFESKLQEGAEEMDWYWFEMLHYRKTGDYAKKLIDIAESAGGTNAMKAYAYAYATHYATDFVGHPYVNTVSGAPYRISVQRHVVIENYMDQWKWGEKFNENISNTLLSRSSQTRFDLPDDIAGLIEQALLETYKDEVHPMRYSNFKSDGILTVDQLYGTDDELNTDKVCFLNKDDIKLAYKAQRLMLDHLGNRESVVKPAEPFPGADQLLSTVASSIDNFSLPSVNVNLPQAEDFLNWDSIIQSIQDTLDFILDSVATIASVLSDIITNPSSVLTIIDDAEKKAVQLVNYWIQLEMYKIFRMINQVLALSGLAYPEPDEVELSNPVARRLITLEDAEKDKDSKYPLLRNPGQPHLDRRAYVDCNSASCENVFLNVLNVQASGTIRNNLKNNRAEQPVTQPSFYPLSAITNPDIFIQDTQFDFAVLSAYAACTTPEAVNSLYSQNKQVGNAIDLSSFIIQNARTTDVPLRRIIFCNWNLDGDRGYGYKCWDGVPPTAYRGEIEGAAENNTESAIELFAQNFKCWTSVDQDLSSPFRSHYNSPVYVESKSFKNLFASPIKISQLAIPSDFFDFSIFPEPIRWQKLVPEYLKIVPGGRQKNYYFVNGMATTRSSGIRSAKSLQHTINTGLAASPGFDKSINTIHIRSLMNYTDHPTYNIGTVKDIYESVVDGLVYSLLLDDAIDKGKKNPVFKDPTIVSILALLHHCAAENEQITLCGHSQGSILLGVAIILFSQTSTRHAAYLKSKVKLMQMEPEITISFRNKIRDTVEEYLVYIMNASDPNGTDILTELASGEFPLMPNQTKLNLSDPNLLSLRDLFENPRLLDVTYYADLRDKFSATGNDIGAYIGLWQKFYENGFDLRPHFMPSQQIVIADDFLNNRFRTDPGTLLSSSSNSLISMRTTQLSTAAAINTKSINVRDFFMS